MHDTWRLTQAWNIPNGLSLSRVALGLTLPLWWQFGPEALLPIVLWAAISDGLDGWWARRYDVRTPLGVVIDPLADKAFTNPFLCLAAVWSGQVLVWCLFLVNLAYDTDTTLQRRTEIDAALCGRYARNGRPVTRLSKAKTAALFGFMLAVVGYMWYPVVPLPALAAACIGLVGVSWFRHRQSWLRTLILRR